MQLQLHYITQHNTTLHYTNYITLRYNYNCSCNYKCNYNYNCTTPHYIQQLWVRWPLQPLQPLQKTQLQLQPPFGPSVDSLCHPWFTTTNLSYRFPILKLPPPPCVALLVYTVYIYIYYSNSSFNTISASEIYSSVFLQWQWKITHLVRWFSKLSKPPFCLGNFPGIAMFDDTRGNV